MILHLEDSDDVRQKAIILNASMACTHTTCKNSHGEWVVTGGDMLSFQDIEKIYKAMKPTFWQQIKEVFGYAR